jgi:hypothetical protein
METGYVKDLHFPSLSTLGGLYILMDNRNHILDNRSFTIMVLPGGQKEADRNSKVSPIKKNKAKQHKSMEKLLV